MRTLAPLNSLLVRLLGPDTDGSTQYKAWKRRIDNICSEDRISVSEQIETCDAQDPSVLYAACIYDLHEIVMHYYQVFKSLSEQNFDEGENCLRISVRFGHVETAKVLVASGVTLAEGIVVAALQNETLSLEFMHLFEKREELSECLTEDAFYVAATQDDALELVTIILKIIHGDNRKLNLVLLASMVCCGKPVAILELLLREYGSEIRISEFVLDSIVDCDDQAVELVTMLLRNSDVMFKITKQVLRSAVINEAGGLEVISLLIRERGNEVRVNEDLISHASMNAKNGAAIISMLSREYGRPLLVAAEMFASIATAKIARLLVEQAGTSFHVDENMLASAMWNPSEEVMALLLENDHAKDSITLDLIKKGLRCGHTEPVALLLKALTGEFLITLDVILAAADNDDDILALVLPGLRWPTDIEITSDLLEKAATVMMTDLFSILLKHEDAFKFLTHQAFHPTNWNVIVRKDKC